MNVSKAFDLKDVIESIISSYEGRIEAIGSIFDATQPVISDLQESLLDTKEEREKINSQLRELLAQKEHLRKKDFDNMMQGILTPQDQREKEVRRLLKDYLDDQKRMAQILRDHLGRFRGSLVSGEAKRIKEFQVFIKEILSEQEKRKEEVTSKLKEFQKQQCDLVLRLRELLGNGNDLRIKDLKLMLKEFKTERERRLVHRKKRKEGVAKMLRRFRDERQRTQSLPKTIHSVPSCREETLGGKKVRGSHSSSRGGAKGIVVKINKKLKGGDKNGYS